MTFQYLPYNLQVHLLLTSFFQHNSRGPVLSSDKKLCHIIFDLIWFSSVLTYVGFCALCFFLPTFFAASVMKKPPTSKITLIVLIWLSASSKVFLQWTTTALLQEAKLGKLPLSLWNCRLPSPLLSFHPQVCMALSLGACQQRWVGSGIC